VPVAGEHLEPGLVAAALVVEVLVSVMAKAARVAPEAVSKGEETVDIVLEIDESPV